MGGNTATAPCASLKNTAYVMDAAGAQADPARFPAVAFPRCPEPRLLHIFYSRSVPLKTMWMAS